MRALFSLLVLVAAVRSEDLFGWKTGKEYRYQLNGRTIAGLDQSNQFSGVVIRGNLLVKPHSLNLVNVEVTDFRVAHVHGNFSSGWDTDFLDHGLTFKSVNFASPNFDLKMKNGVIDRLFMEDNAPIWEVNMIKAIASQFQIDTRAENLKKSRINNLPEDKQHPTGVFKTNEDSVTGICETIYDISPLPYYVLQIHPELAPRPQLLGKGQFIDIAKSINYSKCEHRREYHFGFTGLTDWKMNPNQMGNFISRATISRIIISGFLDDYTIQSSVTTNKNLVETHMQNEEKGIVASRMNVTLTSVNAIKSGPKFPKNPKISKNLIYEYDSKLMQYLKHISDSSSSSSSSSAASSSSGKENRKRKSKRAAVMSSPYSKRDRSSFRSSYSSKEYLQTRPQLYQAPNTPFLPFFVGYKGNIVHSSPQVNGVYSAEKIANQIAEQLLRPNGIVGEQTLTKFNILARVLRTLNYQQIRETGNKLFFPISKADSKSETDALKYQAWTVYRDAVAQAGTGPALLTIQKWIQDQKIQTEEAAEVISLLPDSGRYPTHEYMKAFFGLITSAEVEKQSLLNSTAILAFTDLVRKTYVDKDTMSRWYPVYAFGTAIKKSAAFALHSQYIPHFARHLRQAVQQGDSPRIQIYIRALGNIAHPRILGVFKPYLEGKYVVSNFQRLVMVTSLDRMTNVNPRAARPVLYTIYQNTGESPEVRVAAVMQLMKTNPPAEMLQRMAQFTNSDISQQVISAVKSAIESAAQLTAPYHRELAMNARSAVNLLYNKPLGIQYSKNYLRSYITEQHKLSYGLHATTINSEDSWLPSSFFVTLRKNLGSFVKQRAHCSMMTSSVDQLMNMIYDQLETTDMKGQNGFENKKGYSPNWTMDKIENLLHIKSDVIDQLEGNFMFHLNGGSRFFAFDNHTIEQLPEALKNTVTSLRSGESYNFTKMYNQMSLNMGFPTAMGFPFVFSLQIPTLIKMGGEARLNNHQEILHDSHGRIKLPRAANFSADVKFTYASKVQSKLGFITPFSHQRYMAAYDSNMFVHLPLKIDVDVDIIAKNVSLQIQPLQEAKYQKIAEYSTIAYTTQHDILNLNPPGKDNQARNIFLKPIQRFKNTVGQDMTGFGFDLKMETMERHFDLPDFLLGLKNFNPISSLLFYNEHQSIKPYTNYTISYNRDQSTSSAARFTLKYDNERKYGNNAIEEEYENDSLSSDPEALSLDRAKNFLERVSAGVQDSSAHVLDVSAQFVGKRNARFTATAAYAGSPVSPKSRFLFYAGASPATSRGKPYQFAAEVVTEMPMVPLANFNKALEADPSSTVAVNIKYGQNAESKIILKGTMKQSVERKRRMMTNPLGSLCQEKMQLGDNLGPVCRNVTVRANYMDQYHISAQYKGIGGLFKNVSYSVYSAVRQLSYDYVSEDFFLNKTAEEQVDLDIQFAADLKSVNVSLKTPEFQSKFSQIRVNSALRPILVIHPEFSASHRFAHHSMHSFHYPTCVMDQNYATTFDNRSYPLKIGKCWHVMVHSVPKTPFGDSKRKPDEDSIDKFSFLIRDLENQKRELVFILDKYNVNFLPQSSGPADYFKVNGKKIKTMNKVMSYFEDNFGNTLVQVYRLPTGYYRIFIPQYGFEVIYDGMRVKLQVPNKYRAELRGLCGTLDGEKFTDFTSPKNCILRKPKEFAASWSLSDTTCEGPARVYKKRAEEASCYEHSVQLGELMSYNKEDKITNSSAKMIFDWRYRGPFMPGATCESMKTLIQQDVGQVCFTKKPVAVCQGWCRLKGPKIQKTVEFYCVTQGSPLAHHFADIIRQGANPNFSKKETSKIGTVFVHESCNAPSQQ